MKTTILSLLTLLVISAEVRAQEQVRVLGYVEPYESIEMMAAESGIIKGVFVKEGQFVKQGEAVMQLDTTVLEAQKRMASLQANSSAAVTVAQAELSLAQEKYNSLARIKRGGSASSAEVSRAGANVKIQEGRLRMAEEEKAIAGLRVAEIDAQIERRILRSPIEGVVLKVNKDVGESADAQAKPGDKDAFLVRIAQINRLVLVAHLPAHSVGNLKVGDQVPVLILKQNSLQADRKSEQVTATIEFLDPTIDPSSETRRAKLVFDNFDLKHQSGSHAYAIVQDNTNSYNNQSSAQ
ncbi:MAG: efflux RND transporter periplasmic adaptor subunit [Verrucomicrobiota bacterium]